MKKFIIFLTIIPLFTLAKVNDVNSVYTSSLNSEFECFNNFLELNNLDLNLEFEDLVFLEYKKPKKFWADTTDWILKPYKKRFYIYNNQPFKPIYKGFNLAPEFENIIKQKPKAHLEFKKTKLSAIGMLAGSAAMLGLAIVEFTGTVSDAKQINSGVMPDSNIKLGNYVALVVAAGVTVYFSLEFDSQRKKGFILFNKK